MQLLPDNNLSQRDLRLQAAGKLDVALNLAKIPPGADKVSRDSYDRLHRPLITCRLAAQPLVIDIRVENGGFHRRS